MVDGRSFGAALAHRLACAVKGGCDDGDGDLRRIYGDRDAELVRHHLQGLVFEPGERQLPVDWRTCRKVDCAVAPDDRDLDVHRSDAGLPATVFTRVLRRGERRYIQYWFYYPDSNSAWARVGQDLEAHAGRAARPSGDRRGSLPGLSRGRLGGRDGACRRDGRTAVRVTSHGHWQWCKHRRCAGRWGPATGWTRVSRGSHAGHVPAELEGPGRDKRVGYRPRLPGRDLRERTVSPDGIRLVPLEGIEKGRYRRLDPGISPPWQKDAYANPDSSGS